ncbi:hypothetical protein EUZ85_21300 [Hahella sp. KA22]|uniref:hypothetical protein n=1 Tax=Hahella sp. KA22 TaxID=1628392 RepID=UPI000FDE61C4|nr:hypothetical protein [Hahella sp. KA22]AZZ93116.1 hypothetical protein ENC22_18715 [Hahella sp. KA22]QAY56490.1 hypothetical protein EUZ85_21300 [Hahella sp. KA22]
MKNIIDNEVLRSEERKVFVIKKVMLFFILSLLSQFCNADYKMEKGKGLELCHEFLDYLNRKPPEYYFMGLKPDEEFKGFYVPKMTPVDKGKYLAAYEGYYLKNLDKNNHVFSEESWLTEKKYYLSDEVETYISRADGNNDGKKEDVLILVITLEKSEVGGIKIRENKGLLYRMISINKDGLFDEKTGYSMGDGFPFSYKGRVYLAWFSEVSVIVHEPTLPYGSDVGNDVGLGVCTYESPFKER